MCADSCMTDGDRVWKARKVFRMCGALVGVAGTVPEHEAFLNWFRGGMTEEPEFEFGESAAIVLSRAGLFTFDSSDTKLQRVASGREAIGSGAVGAICAYEALGWTDPARAVRIACRHDHGSRPPVRTYRLSKET